jgi:hypothetical protein
MNDAIVLNGADAADAEPVSAPRTAEPVGGSSPRLSEHESTQRAEATPLFILAPPRSFTSVACAMLGEHPQMYGVCELHLMRARSVARWWRMCEGASFGMADGLLRVVAELIFGGQTEQNVNGARGWIVRRSHWTTGFLLENLAMAVYPRILVDKSPSIVYELEFMQRALGMFPTARFLHLTRSPIGQGESLMNLIREAEKHGPAPYWMLHLASYPYWPNSTGPESVLDIDPQRAWYELNTNICEFLKNVPEAQQKRVKGEDLLSDPDRILAEIVGWLGLRTDAEAIERMKHPERSPFAGFGPSNAYMGNDRSFLAHPHLRQERAVERSLDGPLSWSADQRELQPRVKALARVFGYQ